MSTRRQPAMHFLKRVKSYGKPVVEIQKRQPSLIRKYKDSDAWLWTEVAAVVMGLAFVVPTAVAFWIDIEDRQTQRIGQAWDSVTRIAPGNSGKGSALEYLNSKGIPLVGINLSVESKQSPSYLVGVNLTSANLLEANLSGATLRGAVLTGADLSGAVLSAADLWAANLIETVLDGADLKDANLSQADLIGADLLVADLTGAKLISADLEGAYLWDAILTGANLTFANLSQADLSGANLVDTEMEGVVLNEADLSGADLSGAKYLSQESIDTACGDELTVLSGGLTIRNC